MAFISRTGEKRQHFINLKKIKKFIWNTIKKNVEFCIQMLLRSDFILETKRVEQKLEEW